MPRWRLAKLLRLVLQRRLLLKANHGRRLLLLHAGHANDHGVIVVIGDIEGDAWQWGDGLTCPRR